MPFHDDGRFARFKLALVRPFATKATRFRLAVTAGFVIAAVGFGVVGSDTRFSVADTIWGVMEVPGASEPVRVAAPQGPSPQYAAERRSRAAKRSHAVRRDANPGLEARAESDRPFSLARRSMCVRLCDGFVFPVGDYHGDSDRAAHEATCQSECPGAKTALFVVPQGSDSIADASQVGTGRNYSALPDAYHYTTYAEASCSCHPPGGNRIKSLLRDFTLRRGDAVMTAKGVQVFRGAHGYPYKRQDFVALSKSRDVENGRRAMLHAIERASLPAATTLADASRTSTPVAASRKPLAPPQRQASN